MFRSFIIVFVIVASILLLSIISVASWIYRVEVSRMIPSLIEAPYHVGAGAGLLLMMALGIITIFLGYLHIRIERNLRLEISK